jgi:hypothetical protein
LSFERVYLRQCGRPSEKRIQKKKKQKNRDTEASEDLEEPQNWLSGESDVITEVLSL